MHFLKGHGICQWYDVLSIQKCQGKIVGKPRLFTAWIFLTRLALDFLKGYVTMNVDITYCGLDFGLRHTQWNFPPKSMYRSSSTTSKIFPETILPSGSPISISFDCRNKVAKLACSVGRTGFTSVGIDFSEVTFWNISKAFFRPIISPSSLICDVDVDECGSCPWVW